MQEIGKSTENSESSTKWVTYGTIWRVRNKLGAFVVGKATTGNLTP